MSFNDVVLKDYAHEYTASVTVDELHERDYGVIVVRGDVAFTVPWPSVKFTMGQAEQEGPYTIAEAFRDTVRGPMMTPAEAEAAMKEGVKVLGDRLARLTGMSTIPEPTPKTNARPCPVCVGVQEEAAKDPSAQPVMVIPNHRSRVSFLCEEHATPENVKLFRKEKP